MDNNAHSYAKLDALLDLLRSEKLESDDVKACVDALTDKTVENIAAQKDPYGHAWRPGKDGHPVLQNAMQAISIEAHGTTIEFAVSGPEALHHVGAAKGYRGGSGAGYKDQANLSGQALGGFRRPLIPFSKIPGEFKAILRKVLFGRLNSRLKEAA
jgi:hypothetical protein